MSFQEFRGPSGKTAPSLAGWYGRHTFLNKAYENTPENLEKWLDRPSHRKPGTNMPDMNLSPRRAGDMAAVSVLDQLASPAAEIRKSRIRAGHRENLLLRNQSLPLQRKLLPTNIATIDAESPP